MEQEITFGCAKGVVEERLLTTDTSQVTGGDVTVHHSVPLAGFEVFEIAFPNVVHWYIG